MRSTRLIPFLSLLAACQGVGGPKPVEAVLRNPQGADIGRVTVSEKNGLILIHIRATGLVAGSHGTHLHVAGQCDGPDFQSAGSHLNPTSKKHGILNPEGHHLGDLPNLIVAPNGRAEAIDEVLGEEAKAGLKSFVGPNGFSLVIHADPDDQRTDPSGNSGARIACAVIRPGAD
jgi:Cu-Zn family superoxide dismutase